MNYANDPQFIIPSLHTLRAALRTAALLDSKGSSRRAAQTAYVQDPSGAVFNGDDLRRGEDLLLAGGLVIEVDSILFPSPSLTELLITDQSQAQLILLSTVLLRTSTLEETPDGLISSVHAYTNAVVTNLIPDPEAREAFLIALANASRDLRKEVGMVGEELVAATARGELQSLGHPNLAAEVRRVSTLADTLGYDVTAPLITGGSRRLEVKTTQASTDYLSTFFISRNEFIVGLRDDRWALVICELRSGESRVVGWCRGSALAPYVPVDSPGGVWTEARIVLPTHMLRSSIPPAM